MFEGETKKVRGKRERGMQLLKSSFYRTVLNNNNTWQTRQKCLAKIDCHSLWPLPSQLGIALVKRQARPTHLCLWASFAPIVSRNSRWGCRSVTLQQNRVGLFNPIFLSCLFSPLFFLSTSPCGLNIYGLVKPTWNGELNNISSVKVLSERP